MSLWGIGCVVCALAYTTGVHAPVFPALQQNVRIKKDGLTTHAALVFSFFAGALAFLPCAPRNLSNFLLAFFKATILTSACPCGGMCQPSCRAAVRLTIWTFFLTMRQCPMCVRRFTNTSIISRATKSALSTQAPGTPAKDAINKTRFREPEDTLAKDAEGLVLWLSLHSDVIEHLPGIGAVRDERY